MKFVTPEVEVIKFEQVDVIATSTTSSKPTKPETEEDPL